MSAAAIRRSKRYVVSIMLATISLTIGLTAISAERADAATYSAMSCSNSYWANLSALQYLDFYGSATDYGYCVPVGLFNGRNGYIPVFASETNVANDYGKTPVYQNGNCSPPALPTGPSWDFLLPCQAHDYCYDLRKAGFSGTVSDTDCDNAFYYLMEAHCNNRVLATACRVVRDSYYSAVSLPGVVTDPDPVAVPVKAVHSAKCADVTGSSQATGASLVQYSCTNNPNQKFKFLPAPGAPGYFLVRAEHSGKCADVNSSTNGLAQYGCGTYTEQRFAIQSWASQNSFTLRSQLHGGSWCWDVPGSSTATVQLTEYQCFETTNQRWNLG